MQKRFSGSMIFGTLVILFGLLLLARNLFDLHIPVFSMVVSLGMIWIGILLIMGQVVGGKEGERVPFGERTMQYIPGQTNYRVLFGSGTLNLQDLRPDQPLHLYLDCTFGEMKLIVNREVPLQVDGTASFGSLNGPDLRTASFGNYFYTSTGYNPSLPGLTIHARVTFGELRIFYL
jgi:predicted membrane protein